MAVYNPSAFPHTNPNEYDGKISDGMTLRDWFAGQLAAAAIGACAIDQVTPDPEAVARDSYRFADAMLAARQTEASGNAG